MVRSWAVLNFLYIILTISLIIHIQIYLFRLLIAIVRDVLNEATIEQLSQWVVVEQKLRCIVAIFTSPKILINVHSFVPNLQLAICLGRKAISFSNITT